MDNKSKTNYSILFTGGGTGGHTFTCEALFSSMVKSYPNMSYYYIGSYTGLEKSIFSNRHRLKYFAVYTGKLRRYFSWLNLTDFFRLIMGVFQSIYIIYTNKIDIIFSSGGYVGLPVVIAGFLLRVKNIVIHEQTAAFGLSNKISSYMSNHILLANEGSKKFLNNLNNVSITGQPIRKGLLNGSKEIFYNQYDFNPNIPTIYISGGSQGARSINTAIFDILKILEINVNIILQHGYDEVTLKSLKKLKAELSLDKLSRCIFKPFFSIDELKHIFVSIDLFIGRSGAMTVSELMYFKIPAILCPIRNSINSEQYLNAKYMMDNSTGFIFKDNCKLSFNILSAIKTIFSDNYKLSEMKSSFNKSVFIDNNQIINNMQKTLLKF